MLDQIVKQAWQADTCDLPTSYVPLPQRGLDELNQAIEDLKKHHRPIETFHLKKYNSPALQTAFAPVVDALKSGSGFAIVDRIPMDEYSPQEARLLFWLLGQLIGPQYEQNSGGSVLFDVRDEGQDVRKGARYAVTNLELTFHTDNARSKIVPDYVGLLCARPARSGGISQLVNAYAVHNEMLHHHPEELATLYEPFYFDRRGLNLKNEPEISEFPILEWNGNELLCRFIRLYIEVAHKKKGQPLTPGQVRALDIFQETVQQEKFRVEFTMERGQILFTNNHWILHNRTTFEDHTDPTLKRHLVRLWLAK